jgi:predicted phosphodiesterase
VRVAALYDIHGNLPALDAVLVEVEESGADLVLVGGDVALGPMPRETLERVLSLGGGARFVRGNCDRELARSDTESEGLWAERSRWTAAQLTEEQRTLLAGLPETAVVDVDGLGPTLFCHATPRSDEEIVTRITPDERLREVLAGVEQDVVVCGHTHVQFDRSVGSVRLVNAGSVGMPYEGEPGAYWALLGPDVQFRRTRFDFDAAAAAVRASGFPGAEEHAVENILASASAEEATQFFENSAHGDTTS